MNNTGHGNKGCGHPVDPENGYCKVSGIGPGSRATYYCNDGYELYEGYRIRKCGYDGQWNGKQPSCRKIGKVKKLDSCQQLYDTLTWTLAEYSNKGCGHPKDPKYGSCKVLGTGYGSKAIYSCDKGYRLSGGYRVRKCLSNGYWSGIAPKCRTCKSNKVEFLWVNYIASVFTYI